MTAAALLALLVAPARKPGYEQLRTWVVAQAVHNALQTFHGCPALDPDNPASEEGFISDEQMRALNIAIRRAVHEALPHVDTARNVATQPYRQELHPGNRKRWTSARSSSERFMTTWSRRARPSLKRHTSVTSASRASTDEPGLAAPAALRVASSVTGPGALAMEQRTAPGRPETAPPITGTVCAVRGRTR